MNSNIHSYTTYSVKKYKMLFHITNIRMRILLNHFMSILGIKYSTLLGRFFEFGFCCLADVLNTTSRLKQHLYLFIAFESVRCFEPTLLLQLDGQFFLIISLLWVMALRNAKFRTISLSYWIVLPKCIMKYSSKGSIFW